MRSTRTMTVLSVASIAALAFGCGGASKTSKKGMSDIAGSAPPPPSQVKPGATIDRNVTKEASKDFQAAFAFYKQSAADGWTSDECNAAASKFEGVASDHDKLVEAYFNAGLSYHNCNMMKAAEGQYQRALKVNASHAPSLTGLGEIYFRGGNEKRGVEYWNKAVQADAKTTAARNNLAWVLIGQMRTTNDKSTFNKYEEEAKGHLSRVLAVDSDNIEAYVLYSLLFQEGSDQNKSRLDLANLLLDEGAKRRDDYAPLYNARGLLLMKRQNVGQALTMFERAVALDPRYPEARMNVGNVVLGFRKYDAAAEQFNAVLKMQPKNYEAMVGLGIAHRGLKDLDAAEQAYTNAKELDGSRGLAYFNLGLLYKDFRASGAANEKAAIEAYRTAKKYFEQFLSKNDARGEVKDDAKDHVEDCDKYITQLEQAIRAGAGGGA